MRKHSFIVLRESFECEALRVQVLHLIQTSFSRLTITDLPLRISVKPPCPHSLPFSCLPSPQVIPLCISVKSPCTLWLKPKWHSHSKINPPSSIKTKKAENFHSRPLSYRIIFNSKSFVSFFHTE